MDVNASGRGSYGACRGRSASQGTSRRRLRAACRSWSKVTSRPLRPARRWARAARGRLPSIRIADSRAFTRRQSTEPRTAAPGSLDAYLASTASVRTTLLTLPTAEEGIPLKRALLDALEDEERRSRGRVPDWLLALRGAVLNGEL